MTISGVEDKEQIKPGDELYLAGAASCVRGGKTSLRVENKTRGISLDVNLDLDEGERGVVVAGGRLNQFRQKASN